MIILVSYITNISTWVYNLYYDSMSHEEWHYLQAEGKNTKAELIMYMR
jgi:hypothetical protein